MAAVKVPKLVDKSRVLLLAGLTGIEQQLIAHGNGLALPFEVWVVRHMKYVLGIHRLNLTGLLGAEFAPVDSNAIPLCILNRFVEFAALCSTKNCEWVGDGRRKR